ncbi:acyltransferase domain-containing protein [Streptomyces sp. NPDC090073]|uniref:acyltransferase domain-containing protein n=1 Tax=Streptomyces sp. NPDC090073 TaxID=3365936 RepID=UPI00381DE4FA
MRDTHATARMLRQTVTSRLHEAYGVDPGTVTDDRPLSDYGLTSREAVSLAGELAAVLGTSLPPTLIWEAPTLGHLLRWLVDTADGTAGGEGRAPARGRPDARQTEIAVVGIGCRLPGGIDSPREFWRVLNQGRDVVGSVPPGRWASFRCDEDGPVGLPVSSHGGYLGDIAGFDAAFFGISPKEARAMDPQQRMVLEVTREALDHAAISVADIAGTRTGVFVGISGNEYAQLTSRHLRDIDGWTAPGGSLGLAAGRLSYVLDARGPSMALDTACSSSLVAVHQAVLSLRSGESDLAVVAGVNLLLSPATTLALQRAGTLSPGGRCRAFAGTADGMVRAEGCTAVVLQRLDDAESHGSRVLAVIRASAVNSDGRSNGLLAPSVTAQRGLLDEAYANGPVRPAEVDYVEAHGTGTALGDPIEARALSASLGRGRAPDRPLLIGSVKTNVGHLEAAAGLTGLVKTVLALSEDRIPPSLHFTAPNPHVDFEQSRLRVAGAAQPWPRYSGRATAGVSAFGFGGTNAHVVLQEYTQPSRAATASAPEEEPPALLLLDAPTSDRLAEYAGDLARWMAAGDGRAVATADVARSLAGRAGRGAAKAAVVARDRQEAAAALDRLASGGTNPRLFTATARAGHRPVWVFSGYGSQWPGMGRRLMRTEPAFAAAIARLAPAIRHTCGISLTEYLQPGADLSSPAVVQPVLFGIQVALTDLWRSYGVKPAAVIGHSMGEVAAAVACGALGAEDGAHVIGVRSRLLDRLSGGAMAVVDASAAELRLPASAAPDLAVAVHSSPGQCVVSGSAASVDELLRKMEDLGTPARRIPIALAAHTSQVDPLLDELLRELCDLSPRSPDVTMYSTVTGKEHEAGACDSLYWAANLRQPVRFADAVASAVHDGHQVFVELSPHPTLSHALSQNLRALDVRDPLVLGSMRRDTDDAQTFRAALAALAVHGHRLHPRAVAPHGHITDIPLARWRHQRFWPDDPSRADGRQAPKPEAALSAEPGHSEARHEPEEVLTRLRQTVATIMGYLPDHLDTDAPLTGLGLDSLMAARIQAAVERDFGLRLPSGVLTTGATIKDTAALIGESGRACAKTPRQAPLLPRDEAERLVVSCWNAVTGADRREKDVRAVPRDLPCDRDLTARYLAALSSRMAVPLTRKALGLAGPQSFEDIAARLRPLLAAGAEGMLRAFNSYGSSAPLYLVHPAGGTSAVYRTLAERLAPDRPCFGLDRIEEDIEVAVRAERYASLIGERHVEGPCVVGGWSYGGVVAHETARLLTARGVRVDALILIDSVLPLPAPLLTPYEEARRRYHEFSLYTERTYGRRLDLPYEQLALLDDMAQTEMVVEALERHGDIPAAVLTHQRDSLVDLRSAERHTPQRYAGRTILFRATKQAPHTVRDARFDRTDQCLGWTAHCTDLTVVPLPGHHLELLDPPAVDVLAGHLVRHLVAPDARER